MITTEQIKSSIDKSMNIYWKRMTGQTKEWSASTKCKICKKWWMWGVRENLYFTCPDCKSAN